MLYVKSGWVIKRTYPRLDIELFSYKLIKGDLGGTYVKRSTTAEYIRRII